MPLVPYARAALVAIPFALASSPIRAQQAAPYTLEQIKSYPFPNELTAAATGSRLAWALNERGSRNIFVSEGPDYRARQLTTYRMDDGQELTSVSVSPDGRTYTFIIKEGQTGHLVNIGDVPAVQSWAGQPVT